MFNPIFNKDGSLSFFRLFCLIVAVSCATAYYVTGQGKDTKSVAKTESAQVSEVVETAKADAVKEDEPEEVSPVAIREKALLELKDESEYMQICGAVDNGYDNCSVDLPEELESFYSMRLHSWGDGYKLVLLAKDENKDLCRQFESNSNGEIIGFNENGEADQKCLLGLDNLERGFTVLRDTDNNEGLSAPSGLSPLVTNLSKR